jgi:cyanophycinase-like exopeptidase
VIRSVARPTPSDRTTERPTTDFRAPELLGVGIDEGTAVILQGTTMEVLGRSAVMIVDARAADVARATPGQPVAGRSVKLTILRDGMSASLR